MPEIVYNTVQWYTPWVHTSVKVHRLVQLTRVYVYSGCDSSKLKTLVMCANTSGTS